MNQTVLVVASTAIAIFMVITMNFMRMKSSKKPVTAKKIILPPFFMSSGLLMFLIPLFRVGIIEILEAVLIGALFSIFLIKTSKFTIEDDDIYLVPSKAFIIIILILFIIRLILKRILETQIDVGQTSGMFYILALSMIFTWRIAMLIKYNQLKKQIEQKNT
ncbi:MAG TPA: cytochrome c biogenesis protein CcdC [Pseudogracilibacillus sp.]|nr:cytochrome c biogenesis protein CcdC [Pseudogracilibacillus sp.]